MKEDQVESIWSALDTFRIELPSWGFANTGTRFGKFLQPAAARTLEDKLSDAGEVNKLTGICPTVALHILWDLPHGMDDIASVQKLSERYGVRPGSINPNLFQAQEYKHGSVTNSDAEIRRHAQQHLLDCVEIAKKLSSKDVAPWFADGSNYPGTQNIRKRIAWLEEAVKNAHDQLGPDQRLLIEYKPFEPYFYHTDVADWGMAFLFAKAAGPKSFVLVDTGHHYQSQNIEQIVAWLLYHNMLGGFHFNDRRYADDDLTIGSIDPYQIFRIFHEILNYGWDTGKTADIAYMVDQSHNLKPKMEAMIQTVSMAQELFAKASLVDRKKLAVLQEKCDLVSAEECLRTAFWQDVRPIVQEWRQHHSLPADPLQCFRESGYLERISKERGQANMDAVSTYA